MREEGRQGRFHRSRNSTKAERQRDGLSLHCHRLLIGLLVLGWEEAFYIQQVDGEEGKTQ